MISRFITVTALMTGAALLCLPAQAQTGTSSQGTGNTPSTYPSTGPTTGGTVGTTNSTGMGSQGTMSGQGSTMSDQSGSMGSQGSMGAQGTARSNATSGTGYQAQAAPTGSGRMRRGDAAERQMTECLNNAAAQHQPLNSCRR